MKLKDITEGMAPMAPTTFRRKDSRPTQLTNQEETREKIANLKAAMKKHPSHDSAVERQQLAKIAKLEKSLT